MRNFFYRVCCVFSKYVVIEVNLDKINRNKTKEIQLNIFLYQLVNSRKKNHLKHKSKQYDLAIEAENKGAPTKYFPLITDQYQ